MNARFLRAMLGGCLTWLAVSSLRASDWPHFLGPTHDAVYAGPALVEVWPREGPAIVWQTAVGEGYSSPVVGEGRLVICHRLGDELVVDCLDPRTGNKHWGFRQKMKFQDGAYFDNGPRPTPAINQGKVYVHNTDGYLACLDLRNGTKLWSRNAKSEFQSSATWHGCVASPLLTDKAVILPIGGTNGGGVVAFARTNGEPLWHVLDEKASAASPVLATLDGKLQVVVVTRNFLHGLDPETGQDYWRYETHKQSSGNVYAASPAISGDYLFLSAWYRLGARVLRLKDGHLEKLWTGDNSLSTHYATGIIYDQHIYGFHGHAWERGGPSLRCIELASGKVLWEQPQAGSGTIVRFADNLLILRDTGELQLAKASPKEFKVLSRAQVVGRTTRSCPAIADGFVFVKGPRQLVCLDLRAQK